MYIVFIGLAKNNLHLSSAASHGLGLSMAYVYILENKVAERIKIGATFNHPNDRLSDISRMWMGIKGRCQICLSWRLLANGRMPDHVRCSGSGELPLEYSTELAEKQLEDLQNKLASLSNSDLNFATKRIKNLEKIIRIYKEEPVRSGMWELRTSFKIDSAYIIEELAHKALANHLDTKAPFGEVFSCTAEDAIVTIEKIIAQLEVDN